MPGQRLDLPRPVFTTALEARTWAEDLLRTLEQRLAIDQGGVVRRDDLRPYVVPDGDQDGANTDFTVPFRFLTDAEGTPPSPLCVAGQFLNFTTSLTPAAGEWTILDADPGNFTGETAIKLGTAPGASDPFFFPILVSIS